MTADQVLVAGVDTSTQSCKIVVRDAITGALVRSGSARHPAGTEVDPEAWWVAFQQAAAAAGGLADVSALSVGGQQHGMVALDETGRVVRPALLWNDTRSAPAARALISELGAGDESIGARAWAQATGSVPVASLTITKLRWLRDAEPGNAARVAAVALPHDWLTWRIAGYGPAGDASAPLGADLSALTTDRSDASGTGYFDASVDGGRGEYRRDLLELAFGRSDLVLPRVVGPADVAGVAHPSVAGADVPGGALLGPGAGDNAAAAFGLGLTAGQVAVSVGTSGVASAVAADPVADATGGVTGFASASGDYLPLACTLNGAPVLDAACRLLGVDHSGLDQLALGAAPGAGGLTVVPYLDGERTPNRPTATGSVLGLTSANATRENLARAFVEGLACSLADALDALRVLSVPIERVVVVGGGARSQALLSVLPGILGLGIEAPPAGEYVADGAARQAAWVLARATSPEAEPPVWAGDEAVLGSSDAARVGGAEIAGAHPDGDAPAVILERYRKWRDIVAPAEPA